MSVARQPIPKKARNRNAVPWRVTIGKELSADEARVVGHAVVAGTEHHALLQAYVGFGTTIFEGDYWGTKGRENDLSQPAKRWDKVQEQFPELVVDAIIEYRVPEALQDERVVTVEV
ncbi:hypothetical protein SEA_SHARKBOY_66 [Microbacterium phage Sharkboy]|uniref:DUF7252 domain-containing protein n=3 Tax=Dismasvirus dismas TaxID=2560588 RepID=A0A516KUE8_9CAUD|nr:hypothetical protein FDJ24_gp65 [Microbacterium phage Dismas]AVR57224.1 hypothetical protein PBI_KIERAN_63 [Microbacterium phage Kieran]QDP45302.1 hypothetical protein SEA_SHARKBOY_66 [Microbacterium phage Sharkboy]UYL86852.1 hypothetical protein SEA_RONA_64 [Microbacterium phage Rona]WNM67384.1 hypothetical protein SEA_CHILIPEPPER_63 [Microbacterium phage ChiliPepper]AUG84862.1 hypothetical protein PBI_DISMAS_65 [Microbacterium phage Dismas]